MIPNQYKNDFMHFPLISKIREQLILLGTLLIINEGFGNHLKANTCVSESCGNSEPATHIYKVLETFAGKVLMYGKGRYGQIQSPLFVDGISVINEEPVRREIYRATENALYPEPAELIREKILEEHFNEGFYLPTLNHIYTRLVSLKSCAFLHIIAAMESKIYQIPSNLRGAGETNGEKYIEGLEGRPSDSQMFERTHE